MDRAGIARESAQSHTSAKPPRRIQPFTIIRDDVIARLGACVSDKAFKLYVLVAHGKTPARFAHWDAEIGAFEIPLDSFAALLKCSRDTARRARNELVRQGFWILRRPGRGQSLTMYQFNPRDWHYVCSQRVEKRAINDAPLNAGIRGSKRASSEVATVLPRAGWRTTPEFEAAQRDADAIRAELGLSKMHERYLAACSPGGELDRSAPSARPGEAEAEGAFGAAELNGRAKHANGRGNARNARAPRAPDASEVLSERGEGRPASSAEALERAARLCEDERIRRQRQARHLPSFDSLNVRVCERIIADRRLRVTTVIDAFQRFAQEMGSFVRRESIRNPSGEFVKLLRAEAKPNAGGKTRRGRGQR